MSLCQLSNEIIRPVIPVSVIIIVNKDKGPVYITYINKGGKHDLPGHGSVLHPASSESTPSHSLPPYSAGGQSQTRTRS